MRHHRKGATALLVAGTLALALSVAKAEDIPIGVNMPLTGAFAASGNYVAEGAKIAVDEINARGGVLGRKLRLVVEDNKSNPSEAAAVAEKLITRDKVPVMLGAWGSTLTLATLPRLMDYEVPMVVETSGADKITKSGNPYVFRIAAPAVMEAEGFRQKLGSFGIRKAAFLIVNNDWGRSTQQAFVDMFKKNGVEVGVTEVMDQAAQDISAQLTRIKATDADTLIVTTAVEQLTLVLRQASGLGLPQRMFTTGGSQSPDQLVEHAGDAANGTVHLVFFSPWAPDETGNPDQARAFIKTWSDKGLPFAGLTESFRGHDGISVIAAALEKAGSDKPAAITEALWSTSIDGLNGPISFQKDGPEGEESGQSAPRIYFIEVNEGKISLLP
jgi:branched-chain amino acid transport system substrate-binding protein